MRAKVSIDERYEVDKEGNVYSPYKKLKQTKTKRGYIQVSLGRSKSVHVHRLVAAAFVPNPNNLDTVNHIDNDKSNNHADNLEWVTQAQNVKHMVDQDRQAKGRIQHLAKLSEEQVVMIRSTHKPGDSNCGTRPLARALGVTPGVINGVVKRKTWKHL